MRQQALKSEGVTGLSPFLHAKRDRVDVVWCVPCGKSLRFESVVESAGDDGALFVGVVEGVPMSCSSGRDMSRPYNMPGVFVLCVAYGHSLTVLHNLKHKCSYKIAQKNKLGGTFVRTFVKTFVPP